VQQPGVIEKFIKSIDYNSLIIKTRESHRIEKMENNADEHTLHLPSKET
jgi:hypothetical protein